MEDSNPDQPYAVTSRSKQEREVFVAIGGMHTLLRLFSQPFAEADARAMSARLFQQYVECWNEALVVLREVSYSVPTLSEQLFDHDQVRT